MKHLGSTGGLLTMLCFHEYFNDLYSFEYFCIYCLAWIRILQIWLIVLVAVANEKQISSFIECLRKMDTLMKRQTTPVKWINKSLFFWLQRMSLISRQRFKKKLWKKRPINWAKFKWEGCIVESSCHISKHQQINKPHLLGGRRNRNLCLNM